MTETGLNVGKETRQMTLFMVALLQLQTLSSVANTPPNPALRYTIPMLLMGTSKYKNM